LATVTSLQLRLCSGVDLILGCVIERTLPNRQLEIARSPKCPLDLAIVPNTPWHSTGSLDVGYIY
jgi:hypothetical protein